MPPGPPPVAPPAVPPAGPRVDAASELKRKLLFVRADRNNFTLVQDTQTIEMGMFGGDAMAIFDEFPEAQEEARSFRTKRIVGFALNMAALGLLLIDAAYLLGGVLTAPSGTASQVLNASLIVYAVIAVPALVLSLVGGLLTSSATSHFFNAVARYNAALINKQLPPENQINVKFFSMPTPFVLPFTFRI